MNIRTRSSWKATTISGIVVVVTLLGCAQVPKESVELSATVGRDIASVHKAHRELAQLVFERMRRDINRFVDNVYAPHQIRAFMEADAKLAKSSSPDDQKRSLLLAINNAFAPNATSDFQAKVLKGMELTVLKIQKDVQSFRKELLDPINEQEKEVLGSIDRAYQQLHYANSIVTGHLSSVVKVHETQSSLLSAIGVERDLRKEVGETLSDASNRIGDLVDRAESVDEKLSKTEESAKNLKAAIADLKAKLAK